MNYIVFLISDVLLALTVAGVVYTLVAATFIGRFFQAVRSSDDRWRDDPDGVTILKPLHRAESGLQTRLESFFLQEDLGPIQIVFGSDDADDPALDVVRTLAAAHPTWSVSIVADAKQWGRNRKISNIINMMSAVDQPILVLSDSDIGVGPDYLRHVRSALAEPNVGVVTCPYFGEAEKGFWSQVGAMGLSYHFLPNVIAGVSLNMARPCMGSTIALHASTLDRIGGFEAFGDILADDYAIGAAVRRLGLKSAVAPVLVSHGCGEATLAELFSHELRWARTVKGVDTAGHLGSVVTHPLPLAVLALFACGFSPAAWIALAAASASRVWLMSRVDRVIGRSLGRLLLLPLRDMLSFIVFAGSFFVRNVEWRGAKFHVTKDGDLKPV